LRWAFHKENEADKILHGTTLDGARCGAAKLTEQEVMEIRSLAGQLPTKELADRFRISHGTINAVKARRTWKNLP